MPAGRPTSYDPKFCQEVIELGKEGKSPAEIAAEIGVPRTTMLSWADAHEEFSTALSHAKDYELAWWESQAREGLAKGSAFNAPLWRHSVSGRFPKEPYRERTEVTGKDGGPLETIDRSDLASLPREKREAIRAAIAAAMGTNAG